ncbi:prepilin-type N-terminal cleavage/methylation domain-containing protein [Sphingomonas japonica]|uniref:General secretion pathway protein H n=1 Tax=Sphingomonas japonica TaxID=511662 RepID=A0ABX0TY02_9SPHN|nr:prepilin-type N-terminal cleavage/methylation domain-containing protein [Sphingomonas japonica]NIJ23109.1 general secretion pathway protein H [Sphingomonas japonica]
MPLRRQAGFTLVEMLIVLAIIGVAAGAVTLGIGSATRAPSAESEARRLSQRLQAAADDAMLGDRMIAFMADEGGYGFAQRAGAGWQVMAGEAMGYHRLPGGMVMTLDQRPPVVMGVEGVARPMLAAIEAGEQRWLVRYDGLTATVLPGAADAAEPSA